MIEYVEECVLCARHVLQVLDIIYNQSVDALIEVEEAVDVAGSCSGILALEEACGNIKYACTRIALFDTNADGLNEMCFAHTGGTEDKEWIECLYSGVVGNGFAYRAGNFVARALAVVLESVSRVELRVEVVAAGLLERVGRLCLCLRENRGRGEGAFLLDYSRRVALYLPEAIYNLYALAECFADTRTEYALKALFELVDEKRRLNLKHKSATLACDIVALYFDVAEPCRVLCGANVVFYILTALCPKFFIVVCHREEQKGLVLRLQNSDKKFK